jgi:hypothetical protein
VTEDPDFIVTAVCVQHGMGDWDSVVARRTPMERQAFYYHIAKTEGFNVDWATGAVFKPMT